MKRKKKLKSISQKVVVKKMPGAGYHIFVDFWNEKKKWRFLIDTGASNSVLDKKELLRFQPQWEHRLQQSAVATLGLGGQLPQLASINISELSFDKQTPIPEHVFFALDLSAVNANYEQAGLIPIVGILGSDLLLKWKACVNYGERVLEIRL